MIVNKKSVLPAFYMGLMPTPVFVMIAVVAGLTLNSSATNLIHAVKGASSGTEMVLNGSLGSEAFVILNCTFWLIFLAAASGSAVWVFTFCSL